MMSGTTSAAPLALLQVLREEGICGQYGRAARVAGCMWGGHIMECKHSQFLPPLLLLTPHGLPTQLLVTVRSPTHPRCNSLHLSRAGANTASSCASTMSQALRENVAVKPFRWKREREEKGERGISGGSGMGA